MCVHMILFYSHTGLKRAGDTWLRGAVYAKNTMIKRTIRIDRYTQMARREVARVIIYMKD